MRRVGIQSSATAQRSLIPARQLMVDWSGSVQEQKGVGLGTRRWTVTLLLQQLYVTVDIVLAYKVGVL